MTTASETSTRRSTTAAAKEDAKVEPTSGDDVERDKVREAEEKLADKRDEDEDQRDAPRPGEGISDPSVRVREVVTAPDGTKRIIGVDTDNWKPAPIDPDPVLVKRAEDREKKIKEAEKRAEARAKKRESNS